MCLPKPPKVPQPAERQVLQTPKEATDFRSGLNARRRRGMWAAIMTSPRGVSGAPAVTGTGATTLGGP